MTLALRLALFLCYVALHLMVAAFAEEEFTVKLISSKLSDPAPVFIDAFNAESTRGKPFFSPLKSIPQELHGFPALWCPPGPDAQKKKFKVRDVKKQHRVLTSRPSRIYLITAWDMKHEWPDWLDKKNWSLVRASVETVAVEGPAYQIYRRNVTGDSVRIALPGRPLHDNYAQCFVFVPKDLPQLPIWTHRALGKMRSNVAQKIDDAGESNSSGFKYDKEAEQHKEKLVPIESAPVQLSESKQSEIKREPLQIAPRSERKKNVMISSKEPEQSSHVIIWMVAVSVLVFLGIALILMVRVSQSEAKALDDIAHILEDNEKIKKKRR